MIYTSNLKVTRTLKDKSFTQVDNSLIESELSNKTLGIHVRLLALPPDWFLNMTDLPRRCKCSKSAITTALKELIEKGYLKKVSFIDEKTGHFIRTEYFLSETPIYVEENKSLIDQRKKEQIEALKKGIFPKRISFTHYIKTLAENIINTISQPLAEKRVKVKSVNVEGVNENIDTTNTYSTNTNNNKTSSYKKNSEEKNKLSIENVNQASIKNDDDFSKNFDTKTTDKISTDLETKKDLEQIVPKDDLDSINEANMKLVSEKKDNVTKNEMNEGINDKKNIPPVRPADCGQAVENLRDKVITLFDNTDIEEDFRDKILTKYSNEYELIIKGLEIMSYQENIKNETGWLNKFLEKKGVNYSLPAQLKQKELNQSKETAKHRLAPIIKVFREWYRDNENLDLAKSSLFFSMKELYRQNSQRFIDKVQYCKSQFENFNELTKELFHGEILEIIQAV